MSSSIDVVHLAGRALSIYGRRLLVFAGIGAFAWLARLFFVGALLPGILSSLATAIIAYLVFAALTVAAAGESVDKPASLANSYKPTLTKVSTLAELMARQMGAVLLLAITIVGIPF